MSDLHFHVLHENKMWTLRSAYHLKASLWEAAGGTRALPVRRYLDDRGATEHKAGDRLLQVNAVWQAGEQVLRSPVQWWRWNWTPSLDYPAALTLSRLWTLQSCSDPHRPADIYCVLRRQMDRNTAATDLNHPFVNKMSSSGVLLSHRQSKTKESQFKWKRLRQISLICPDTF